MFYLLQKPEKQIKWIFKGTNSKGIWGQTALSPGCYMESGIFP